MSDERIVSLIPSSTEIVCALGFEGQVVGRSHECDFPGSVKALWPSCFTPPCSTSVSTEQRGSFYDHELTKKSGHEFHEIIVGDFPI